MTSTLTKAPDGTITLKIAIPQAEVAKARAAVIEDAVTNADIPGFRKGKAPKEVVLKHLDEQKLHEEVLKKALPQAYIKAVEEHKLKPVMNPKIHVEKIEDGKDMTFQAITCEMPEVKLKDYKDKIKTLTAKSKIVIPGKEEAKGPSMDEIMQAVASTVEVAIPSILIQQEADRLLSQTLDEIKRLGLTLDQYLASTGKTAEQVRNDYEGKALSDMKLEFALQQIAIDEKITVEQKEITEAIATAKDPKEREQMEKNSYLLASILRQQKTLDFLKNL